MSRLVAEWVMFVFAAACCIALSVRTIFSTNDGRPVFTRTVLVILNIVTVLICLAASPAIFVLPDDAMTAMMVFYAALSGMLGAVATAALTGLAIWWQIVDKRSLIVPAVMFLITVATLMSYELRW